MAAFFLVNMHDLADPVEAALGILSLAVPNALTQPLDLLDDHGLCLHPGETPAGLIAFLVVALFVAGLATLVVFVTWGAHDEPIARLLLMIIAILLVAVLYTALRL
jgi:hypothetical protein